MAARERRRHGSGGAARPMNDRRFSLPDLRLVSIRAYTLAQRHYAGPDSVRQMPPLAEIDRLVAEIDAARAKAGQE